MASRHLSRSIVMQSLYEWDFSGKKEGVLDKVVEKNIKEYGPGLENTDFVWQLISQACVYMLAYRAFIRVFFNCLHLFLAAETVECWLKPVQNYLLTSWIRHFYHLHHFI